PAGTSLLPPANPKTPESPPQNTTLPKKSVSSLLQSYRYETVSCDCTKKHQPPFYDTKTPFGLRLSDQHVFPVRTNLHHPCDRGRCGKPTIAARSDRGDHRWPDLQHQKKQ